MLNNQRFKNLSTYAKPHLNLAMQATLLGVVASLLEVTTTSLMLPLTEALQPTNVNATANTSANLSAYLKLITNLYANVNPQWQLLAILLSLLGITILKNLTVYFSKLVEENFTLRSGLSLRQACVNRFLELEIPYYVQSGSGHLLSIVNEQAAKAEWVFAHFVYMLRELITITLLLWLLMTLSPTLTLITFVCLAIVGFILRSITKSIEYHGYQAAQKIEDFSTLITETINGIRVVKSFNAESREQKSASKALNQRYQAEIISKKYLIISTPLTESLGILVLGIIMYGGNQLLASSSGVVTLPILLTFALTLLRALPRVSTLNGLRTQILLCFGNFEIIQHFLSSTADLRLADGKHRYQTLKSALTFEKVMFTFPTNSKPSIHNISFSVEKGKTTAIVGPSGSGKSTLVDLIMRFYVPEAGVIRIDGKNLNDLQISSWRRAIAMVSQDTFLFNTSIRDNITYGRPEASMPEIIDAAKQAYAFDFIQSLPEGFDTIVGNRGTKLSGGQRQRIAIARAILCNPDILILDEATSALDSQSERIVQQAIEELCENRTVIVIAHRLSTIEKADTIVVVVDGEVAEQGTHHKLLANKGTYYSLHQLQAQSLANAID